jgi:hypothetical protein
MSRLLGVVQPRLVAANKVGGVGQAEPLQGVRRKAGAVTLVAHDHDPPLGLVGDRQPVGTGRVQPPLEDVAVDDHGARQLAVAVALLDGTDVDDQRTGGLHGSEIGRLDPVEAGAALDEQAADGRAVSGWHRQRSSPEVGHGLKVHPWVPFDCCIITGASAPGRGQLAWLLPSQWPVSWLTTMWR